MSRFEDLSKDKAAILNMLISSEEIVKAVSYNHTDFLNQPLPAEPEQLIYHQIYPFPYVPDTSAFQKTYITFSLTDFRAIKNQLKAGTITFYVFTHQDLMRTAIGENRIDYLIRQIDDLVGDQMFFGIGKAQFERMSETTINSYLGAFVSYSITGFQSR